jgi:hypothetical protein
MCVKRFLRPFKNVMGANPPENIKPPLDLESEAVVLCNPGFPNAREALHLFESQRGMLGAFQKKL